MYPAAEGQLNSVRFKLTGSYTEDGDAANALAGFTEKPINYTWHHLDDFDAITGEATLQLVQSDGGYCHLFAQRWVSQYEGYYNVKYRR